MTSESSSDDEEICRLMEAVAPTFRIEPSHNRYKSDKSNGKQGCARVVAKELDSDQIVKPKSRRTDLKDAEEKWNSGHFESVDISNETQNFIAKKLSAALDKQIEDKNPDANKPRVLDEGADETDDSGILLFSNSTFKFTSSDFDRLNHRQEVPKRRPLSIDKIRSRKRKLVDEEESDDEHTKLKSVAVSSDWVLSAK